MAMSGGQGYCVVDETSTSGNRVRLYIYVKEKSQNTSTNSTILRLGMYVNSTYDIGAWVKSSDSYIGTATSGSNCYTFDGSISKGSGIRWLIENKEVTVKHNTDGTKSVKIYWKWGINAYTSYISGYQNPSGSKTVTLTTIPQASTITSANDVTLNGSNQTCTVQVSRKSSSFYHKATITCGSKSVTSNAFATSANITIPNSWLSEFPNATSKRATVTLTTYTSRACTTRVGSTTSTTIQIKAGSSIKPSATNLKLTASVVNGINGYYVKGKSSVKLTTSGAQAGTGASIASYIFTGSNISGSSSTYTGTSSTKTSSIIQSAGNLSYSVQVKDTRGRLSDKKTVKINVIDYTLPAITSLKVERVNGDDTKATVTVRITYKQITVGSTVNEPILTIKKGSENATGILSNPESSSTNSTTNIVTNTYKYTYTGLAETDKPTITATLYDMICGDSNTTTKSVNLSSATRMLNFASNGKTLAVGGFATPNSSTNLFECHWDTQINGNLYIKSAADTEPDTVYASGVPLIIGDKDSGYLALDSNEIMAKNTKENLNGLYLSGTEIFIGDGRKDAKKNDIWFKIPEIQHGIVKITPTEANTPTSKIVTFSKTFSSDPDVIVTPWTAGPYTYVKGVGAYGVSTTQFTACLARKDLQETSLYWIAVN